MPPTLYLDSRKRLWVPRAGGLILVTVLGIPLRCWCLHYSHTLIQLRIMILTRDANCCGRVNGRVEGGAIRDSIMSSLHLASTLLSRPAGTMSLLVSVVCSTPFCYSINKVIQSTIFDSVVTPSWYFPWRLQHTTYYCICGTIQTVN